MTPFEFIQYVVLEQLDLYAIDGVSRAVGAFSRIADEAEDFQTRVFQSYTQQPGEGDPSDFVEEARDQAVAYYRNLENLQQSIINLLAVGLYHLFEQHRDHLKAILKAQKRKLPALKGLPGWPKVQELEYLANTVKHADGPSEHKLRKVRPDLFLNPILRRMSLSRKRVPKPTTNPLGGTDLFVSVQDLSDYRDALRELWEEIRPLVS